MKEKWLSEADFDFQNKVVLVRIDCDVDLVRKNQTWVVDEDFRLRSAIPTIHFLQKKGTKKIILLGHLGRPKGEFKKGLSLQPIANWFSRNIGRCELTRLDHLDINLSNPLFIVENLRFDPGEEGNDKKFANRLASLGDIFINDAFGVSHRAHASIVGIPKLLPSFLGLRFESEVRTLSWLKRNAPRPLVFVLGGSKKDKLGYLEFLSKWTDWCLIGGKLPLLIQKSETKGYLSNFKIGKLNKNNKDITKETIKEFQAIIQKGKTIIWAGPMGVYEEEENKEGSFKISKTVAFSNAFKIAGGGDTHRIISKLDLWDKFNFVSVGGGAMLSFLKEESLIGLEALN